MTDWPTVGHMGTLFRAAICISWIVLLVKMLSCLICDTPIPGTLQSYFWGTFVVMMVVWLCELLRD